MVCVAYTLAGTSMPAFSEAGISHTSSAILFTRMSVFNRIRPLLDIDHHCDLPHRTVALHPVPMLRDAFHVIAEFLPPPIDRSTDQSGLYRPPAVLATEGKRCVPEHDAGRIFPINYLR